MTPRTIAGRPVLPHPAVCWCGAGDCWDHHAECYGCGQTMRRGLLRWETTARSAEYGALRNLVCIDRAACLIARRDAS